MPTITLTVNGTKHDVEVEPRWLLADVLREQLELTGTHLGCEQGVCGACTVLMNGRPVRSCLTLAVTANGADIVTVEGLSKEGALHPVQEAFLQEHALQCGFCTPGMVLTAQAVLDREPHPDADAGREALSGNLCRCTGYQFIVDAVLLAAEKRAGTAKPSA